MSRSRVVDCVLLMLKSGCVNVIEEMEGQGTSVEVIDAMVTCASLCFLSVLKEGCITHVKSLDYLFNVLWLYFLGPKVFCFNILWNLACVLIEDILG
jgi:hypothetical protein